MTTKHDHFVRHPDDDIIDEVRIRVVPRYKESGLSGDEWRISAVTTLYRKGHKLAERSYPSMQAAYEHLAWFNRTWREIDDKESDKAWSKFLKIEDRLCHQPGCYEPSTKVYELQNRYDRQTGARLEVREGGTFRHLRSFCSEHTERGDCGLEDADDNYIDVSD